MPWLYTRFGFNFEDILVAEKSIIFSAASLVVMLVYFILLNILEKWKLGCCPTHWKLYPVSPDLFMPVLALQTNFLSDSRDILRLSVIQYTSP